MSNKLIIVGASGHGKVLADIALKLNRWETIVFADDNSELDEIMGLKVIGSVDEVFLQLNNCEVVVGIGNNSIRHKIQTKLEQAGANIPSLIHPVATIGHDVEIDKGTVVMAGAVINSGTKIGKGCIINTSSSVDHDNVLHDFVHISPGARTAGNVIVGKETWLGIGSVVSNNVKITNNCVIGAAAAVIHDIHESGTYVGVPARRV